MPESVYCPHCDNYVELENDDWDFLDGERHTIRCSYCQKDFVVIVQRPIEYLVEEV